MKFISYPGIESPHGFFGRENGVSGGVFSTLNCKTGAGDDPKDVTENRRRVMDRLRLDPANLVTLTQIHSAICLAVSGPVPETVEGDALVTAMPGVSIGVLTADCAPVLFSGHTLQGQKVIGAAHAGWGGAVKGILEATVAAMVVEGADPQTIHAAIGPCIAQSSYEVSRGFENPFLDEDVQAQKFFKAKGEDKWLFDLPGYAAFRLKRAGVRHISGGDIDTYGDEAAYFSYRRSTHRKEQEYGRQISVIGIPA